jgi:hypothetical protein
LLPLRGVLAIAFALGSAALTTYFFIETRSWLVLGVVIVVWIYAAHQLALVGFVLFVLARRLSLTPERIEVVTALGGRRRADWAQVRVIEVLRLGVLPDDRASLWRIDVGSTLALYVDARAHGFSEFEEELRERGIGARPGRPSTSERLLALKPATPPS